MFGRHLSYCRFNTSQAQYSRDAKDNVGQDVDDDVGLHVLGCRVDILGTNCKKLLKVKVGGGGGG